MLQQGKIDFLWNEYINENTYLRQHVSHATKLSSYKIVTVYAIYYPDIIGGQICHSER